MHIHAYTYIHIVISHQTYRSERSGDHLMGRSPGSPFGRSPGCVRCDTVVSDRSLRYRGRREAIIGVRIAPRAMRCDAGSRSSALRRAPFPPWTPTRPSYAHRGPNPRGGLALVHGRVVALKVAGVAAVRKDEVGAALDLAVRHARAVATALFALRNAATCGPTFFGRAGAALGLGRALPRGAGRRPAIRAHDIRRRVERASERRDDEEEERQDLHGLLVGFDLISGVCDDRESSTVQIYFPHYSTREPVGRQLRRVRF